MAKHAYIEYLLIVISVVIGVQGYRENLRNYYTELVLNRSEQALSYTFPSDARMYEAKNKYPKGTIF